MKLIKNITLLEAALLLAACTQGDPELPTGGNGELVEICPSINIVGMAEAVSTRAATDDGETFYFLRREETGVGTGQFGDYPNDGSNDVSLKAKRSSSTGALTFEIPQYYSTDGRKCRYIGFYPKAEPMGIGPIFNGWHWRCSDGSIDLMFATYLDGSKSNPGISTFSFKHRLAQLQLYPYAETQNIANQWGKITKIEVLNQTDGFTWNDSGSINSESDAGKIEKYGSYKPYPVAGIDATVGADMKITRAVAVQMGGPCMVWPQTDANYNLQLRITTRNTAGVEKVATVGRTGTLLESTPYRLYLRFRGKGVDVEAVTLTVADWTNVAKPDAPAVKTYPYVMNGKVIVFQDADGQVVGSIHTSWMSNTMPSGSEMNDQIFNAVPKKMEIAQSTKTASWSAAWKTQTVCPDPWRMPTLMEAIAMRDLKDYLTGVDKIETDLLIATEKYNSSTNAWYVLINSSDIIIGDAWKEVDKSTVMPIRCVKDLE